jgi:hypothetical protein
MSETKIPDDLNDEYRRMLRLRGTTDDDFVIKMASEVCRLVERIAVAESRVAELEAENQRLKAPASSGVVLIAAERQRQIDVEGWTPEHDDEHSSSELNRAARFYAKKAQYPESYTDVKAPMGWPWDTEWWKPSPDPIRNLVKAGALIAAEIDRLQRLAARAKPAEGEDGKPKIK